MAACGNAKPGMVMVFFDTALTRTDIRYKDDRRLLCPKSPGLLLDALSNVAF